MTKARDNANNWAADITGVTAGTGISGGGTSGAVTVTNSLLTTIDAKGDLLVGSGDDTAVRVAVGTNNHVLTADSATTSGVKWAAAGAGSDWSLITSGYLPSATSITFSSLGAYEKLHLWVTYASSTDAFTCKVLPNASADTVYGAPSVVRNVSVDEFGGSGTGSDETAGVFLFRTNSAGEQGGGSFFIEGCKGSNPKFIIANGHCNSEGNTNNQAWLNTFGTLDISVPITSLQLTASAGNFDGGSYKLWGSTK